MASRHSHSAAKAQPSVRGAPETEGEFRQTGNGYIKARGQCGAVGGCADTAGAYGSWYAGGRRRRMLSGTGKAWMGLE
jgi:hypothetical protein